MAVLTAPTKPPSSRLRGAKLPFWILPLIALVVAVVTVGLFLSTGFAGRAGFIVVFVLLYLIVQSAVSFSVEGVRQARNRLATSVIFGTFLLAMIPLLLITSYAITRGVQALDLGFLSHSMFTINPSEPGGGAYHAIMGTLIVTLIATAIAVPIGVLCAIYLVEYAGRGRMGKIVSFFVDVMVGVPSIVAGLFIYAFWLLALGFQKSGFAGSLALVILMLPIVIRATEEMLKLVPADLREASYALGVPKWRTVLKIVLPTALGGIVTGVMLGVARIMGETAPLLLLVGTNVRINTDPFTGPISTLPTFIFQQFGLSAGNADSVTADRAWAAALTLIIVIILLNIIARLIARRSSVRS